MSRLILARMLIVLLAGAALTAATAVAQTTWYVDDNAPGDPGPGDPSISDPLEDGSAEHPFDAIQEGIDAATDADTVLVADGTYRGVGNKNLDFHGKAITVRSADGPDNCIIDCEGGGRGFYFHSYETATSEVTGFTIANGYVDLHDPGGAEGGGVFCVESSPVLNDCVVIGNRATDLGGGISCLNGSPTLIDCIITGNTAAGLHGAGGGFHSKYPGSSPTLINCTITGNTADGGGGGFYCYEGNPTLIDCTISDNVANGAGGIVLGSDSSPTLVNCLITGNTEGGIVCGGRGHATLISCVISSNWTGGDGGGIRCLNSNTAFIGCLIFDNTASGRGGGIDCNQHPTLTNCTVAANVAGQHGGGIYCAWNSQPTLTNCVLWDNSDAGGTDESAQIHSDGGDMPVVNYSCVEGWTGNLGGTGNMGDDPMFIDPENGDHHLSAGSACIDAGCNCGVPPDTADLDADGDTDEITPLDLDGEGRFFDAPNTPDTGCGNAPIVDMGAYEFGDTGPQPCFGDLDDDGDVDLSDLAALLANYGESDTCDGDLNCDGTVDLIDLAALLADYGAFCE